MQRVTKWVISGALGIVVLMGVFSTTPAHAAFQNNRYSVAVSIGNKNYDHTANVIFAHRDADGIKNYLISGLGFRKANIIDLRDASKVDLDSVFGTRDRPEGELFKRARQNKSNVFVYYSGHGAPVVTSGRSALAYIIPRYVKPDQAHLGYSLDLLFENLDRVRQKIGKDQQLVVMLDACFTGDSGSGRIISGSLPGIAPEVPNVGDIIRITASSKDQIANWDKDFKHGLLTGRFLAGVSGMADAVDFDGNADGVIQWQEFASFVKSEVNEAADALYQRPQDPEIDDASIILPIRSNNSVKPPLLEKWRDDKFWAETEKTGTPYAYQSYVTYCNSICAHRKEADRRIGEIACPADQKQDKALWKKASAANTGAGYRDYLTNCPKPTDFCRKTCAFSQFAKTRLARFAPATLPLPSPPSQRAEPDPAKLATDLQRALKAAKYYTGRVDGVWGRGSRSAPQRVAKAAGKKEQYIPLSLIALEMVTKKSSVKYQALKLKKQKKRANNRLKKIKKINLKSGYNRSRTKKCCVVNLRRLCKLPAWQSLLPQCLDILNHCTKKSDKDRLCWVGVRSLAYSIWEQSYEFWQISRGLHKGIWGRNSRRIENVV